MNPDHLVVVGTIIKPHGIRGEVVVAIHADSPSVLKGDVPLFLICPGVAPRLCSVRGIRPHQDRWLVTLEGIGNRNDAEGLKNADLCIDKNSLAPLAMDECYVFEIIGAAVVDSDGSPVGTVRAVTETGAAPLLEIRTGDGLDFYLPFVEEYIQEFRHADGVLIVRNHEALRDLERG